MPNPENYLVRGKTAYKFRFKRPDTGVRTTMRLGVVSKSFAEEVGRRIDGILECAKYNSELSPGLVDWISQSSDIVYRAFVRTGLLADAGSSTPETLKQFLDQYCTAKEGGSGRTGGWKPQTVKNRKQTVDDLILGFGDNRRLGDINAGDAEDWFHWMQKPKPSGRGLSAPTASKKFKDARQFFRYAVKKKLITDNPFEEMKVPPQDNPDRLVEVTRGAIEQLLTQITDPELRLIVVLARFAGLRVPSEISTLRWRDVDVENKTLHIFAPKTEHHSRGGRRICPLFPELLPYFEAVRPADASADAYVIKTYRGAAKNLRTTLDRKIEAAGLIRWPKLFQNLRANALTDLAESHPIHTVCRWLGNTVEVAMRHYLVIKQREYAGPGSEISRGQH